MLIPVCPTTEGAGVKRYASRASKGDATCLLPHGDECVLVVARREDPLALVGRRLRSNPSPVRQGTLVLRSLERHI
jgi:hypothetical protein